MGNAFFLKEISSIIDKMKKLSDVWLKASVVGSLWATFEIVVGSFFHNLRVPMAGTILAMISVIVMVAFHRHWKQKGLLWRAGLICALMKSISPSAILLGPMTGIMAEALLMEFFVRLFGANITGYMIAGSFALMSTIAHKIVNLLMIYGFDIVTVLVNLYKYATDQIGFTNLKPEYALWILFSFYAVLGIVASIIGFLVGEKKSKPGTENPDVIKTPEYNSDSFFHLEANQNYSVKLLFFHVFAIIVCLLIVSYSYVYGLVSIFFYVLFTVFHYRQSLKHLKRPFFWFQVIVLTFLATLFYNGFNKGDVFNHEGLIAGVQMNVRAVLILVGFSSVSIEMRNPLIKNLLMKRGFSQLYLSLGLAFSVLPWVIKNAPKPLSIIKSPTKSISGILDSADLLLELFKKIISKPKVVIITGEKQGGKTTFASKLTTILKANGKLVGGFLAPGEFENNRRSSFSIFDIESEKSKPLCSIHFDSGEKIGPFRFNSDGQNVGYSLLSSNKTADKDFVVVDEVGPLEMKGEGWASSIDQLILDSGFVFIWIVRKSLVEGVIKKWNIIDLELVDIEVQNEEEVGRALLKY